MISYLDIQDRRESPWSQRIVKKVELPRLGKNQPFRFFAGAIFPSFHRPRYVK
ncbi:MAG: hypothetical protein ABI905_01545 [Betaproteobacteria bacterium]